MASKIRISHSGQRKEEGDKSLRVAQRRDIGGSLGSHRGEVEWGCGIGGDKRLCTGSPDNSEKLLSTILLSIKKLLSVPIFHRSQMLCDEKLAKLMRQTLSDISQP